MPSGHAQSDQGPRCPLPESLDTMGCINGGQRSGRDLAHARDYMNPHILCMLEDTPRLDVAHIFVKL